MYEEIVNFYWSVFRAGCMEEIASVPSMRNQTYNINDQSLVIAHDWVPGVMSSSWGRASIVTLLHLIGTHHWVRNTKLITCSPKCFLVLLVQFGRLLKCIFQVLDFLKKALEKMRALTQFRVSQRSNFIINVVICWTWSRTLPHQVHAVPFSVSSFLLRVGLFLSSTAALEGEKKTFRRKTWGKP